MTADLHAAARKAALASLWRRRLVWPLLEVYLDRDQLTDARAFFEGCDVQQAQLPKASWVDDISRQRGKSWKWCTIATVWAHCHAGQYIAYAAQLALSVRGIIAPTINALLADMPEEMRPTEDKADHIWRFPKASGQQPSEIKAAGVNLGHHDDLRGPKRHLIIQDECGFYDRFEKVQEVLLPQLQTTAGCCVYASTPPDSPSHPFEQVVQANKARGRHVHRTIYNHPRMSPERIEEYLEEQAALKGMTLAQFKATTYFRREFLCMHIIEATRAVVPEWSEDAGPNHPEGLTWGDVHTKELERPLFYDAYDGLDIGFTRDPSAWLGGYWDWSNARLVIEDETPPLYRTRSDALAEAILAKRAELWPVAGRRPSNEAKKSKCGKYWAPHLSVGDGSGNGAEKLAELAEEGLDFIHAEKPDLESRVNAVRTLLSQGKLWIHPRCVHLRKQLATGLWADKWAKNDFERSEEGHLDHVAALVDLVHHVDRQRRPVPFDFGRDVHNTVGEPRPTRGSVHELNKALGEWA